MPERTAKALELGGNGGTFVGFFTALAVYLGNTVDWLNTNYMAVIAICTIVTCVSGVYGGHQRRKLAKEQRRRDSDDG